MPLYFPEENGIRKGTGIKVVIYGQEGVGKTSLAARFPGAVFIDCEGSTSKMDLRRLPKPTSWEMLNQEMQYVLQTHNEKGYGSVIIDTFDWAERLALQALCQAKGVNGIEDFGYGKGWEYEAESVGKFLDFTEKLISTGINMVLNCHAITRKASVPEIDAEFDHWELKLGNKTTNKIAPLLKEWSDLTLFCAFKTNVIATDDKGKKHKAVSSKRVMYTTKTAWWDAKNRFGLPEELPLAYESIAHIFEGCTPAPQTAAPSMAQQVVNKAQSAGIPATREAAPPDLLDNVQQIYPPTEEKQDPWDKPETPQETQTQYILDGIAPELAQLMAANGVKPEEIQTVVGARGYFPADMPVQQYPQDFVQGCLVAAWQQVHGMILETTRKRG
ncbi:MAG: AAA family ATPase [Ruminococcus sp.]|nr:AAA family ATPase [Ruminococcus sp.]